MESWVKCYMNILRKWIRPFSWFFHGTCLGIVRQEFPQEPLSFPLGKPVFSFLENFGFPPANCYLPLGSLVYAYALTLQALCVFAPCENSFFSLCPHPCPPNCWESLLRPSRRGVPLHCKPFCVFGPRAKFVIFLLPPPFAPQKIVECSLSLYRGGEQLDGVSSTSL